MLKHYLKTAFRSFGKSKAFTAINILGLSIGLASTLLISLFIIDQFLIDDFLKTKEDIVRLEGKSKNRVEDGFSPSMHPAFGPVLAESSPEIMAFCAMNKFTITVKQIEGQKTNYFEEDFLLADSSFFTLFPFEMKVGNPKTALCSNKNVVITEKSAEKYFGTEDPIGKKIIAELNERSEFVVAGVLKDIPKNSSLQFDFLVLKTDNYRLNAGAYSPFTTFFLLSPQTNRNQLLGSFSPIIEKATSNAYIINQEYRFTSFADIRYNQESQDKLIAVVDKQAIIMFGIVAVLILLLATINYINLTASRALQRGQEAGIRKIVGAGRGSFIYQFLTESLLTCFIALPISLLLLEAAIPYFEFALGQSLYFDYSNSPKFFLILFATIICLGFIAGLYPALIVSRFKFTEFIKGKILSSSRGNRIRKSLVVFQFIISIALILCSVMVERQLRFVQEKTLAYNPEQILVVKLSMTNKFREFKQSLSQIPEVLKASLTTSPPGGDDAGVRSRDNDLDALVTGHYIDEDYLQLLDLELVEGDNFIPNNTQANENDILVNETMAKLLVAENPFNAEDPLHEPYPFRFLGTPAKIRGVIKDFHMESLHSEIGPMIFMYKDFKGRSIARVLIKIRTENIPETLERIEGKWQEFVPNYPFRSEFLDTRFQKLYTAEMRMGRIFNLFTLIAILISSMGLFGLITFLIEAKMKEISIRKVLGASVSQIIVLLSKQVYGLIAIAAIIAIPLSYFLIENWLDGFAYRVNISLLVILITTGVPFAISGLTMISKTFKTASTNPVDALRSE